MVDGDTTSAPNGGRVNPTFEHSNVDMELNSLQVKESATVTDDDQTSGCKDVVFKWRPWIPLAMVVLYNVYLGYAIYYHARNDLPWLWCDGLGFVFILTMIAYAYAVYKLLHKRFLAAFDQQHLAPLRKRISEQYLSQKLVRLALYAVVFASITLFLVIDSWNDQRRLISALGVLVLIGAGALASKHPRQIRWRQVTWGLVLQFLFGLLILRWDKGRETVDCLGKKVDRFLAFTDDGSGFVFGYLVHGRPFILPLLANDSLAYQVTQDVNEARAVAAVVAFKALAVIYFFSFIVDILFHYGVIQWITQKVGYFLRLTVGTTACESLTAAGNIFLGQAIAPLLIEPYLSRLTLSEVHCVMTSGFATIAGTVMAAYITFGVPPAHLLSASVMSAPAALAFAKLFYPETQVSHTTDEDIRVAASKNPAANLLDAATRGAAAAATLVLNIVAIVIAFIAFISFLNALVAFFGSLVGLEQVTFEWLLGKLFIPLAFLMGVQWDECEAVGQLIGIKTVVNEFVAYRQLGLKIAHGQLSPRSVTIATYALCGFANPGSAGVQIAVLSAMCPQRQADFAKVVMRAFVAGSAACFLTACIAGALYTDGA